MADTLFKVEVVTQTLCIIAIFSVIFVAFEKVRKELFVQFITHSKTKRELLSYFNLAQPAVILSEEGTLQFFNESFEDMLAETLGIQLIPSSFFTLLEDKDQEILKQAISKAVSETSFEKEGHKM